VLSRERLIYGDGSCKIQYNIWNENGDMGFRFYSKEGNLMPKCGGEYYAIPHEFEEI
jgi:hypothetical protein